MPNAALLRHWDLDAQRVLVPLCGKSADLAWLAERGHEVTGVELSPIACEAFFAERGLEPTRDVHRAYVRWRAGRVTLLQGDIFQLDEPFDAVWDRAALIALPPAQRGPYADLLRRWAPRGLLVTLVYDQSRRDGPPFSVPDEEVRRLHPEAVRVEAQATGEPRWDEIGGAQQVVWRI